ncbi:MAG: hypothetical protein V3T41_05430, partial [bacterium]
SFVGKWGSKGTGDGQFRGPLGVALAPRSGDVYVVDIFNHRVQYFTATGSFLGKIGRRGWGNGEFVSPSYCGFLPDGRRLYVTDTSNYRVQYFRWSEPAVSPTSRGKVKALFR